MRRSASRRSAFTLVELLVVISIIGMLMALLFPAVQAARETARGNTCRNNMRSLTQAVAQFDRNKNSYPGYVNEFHPAELRVNGNPTNRSWMFMVLPQMERMDIYTLYTEIPGGAGVAGSMNWAANPALAVQPTENLEFAQCPSNPPDGLSQTPPTSFVVNTGLPDFDNSGALTTPREWQATGVFHDTRPIYNMGVQANAVTRVGGGYVGTGDGTATTILMTENVDADSWVLSPDTTSSVPGTPEDFERRLGCNWTAAMQAASTSLTQPDGIVGPPNDMRPNQNFGIDTNFTVWDGTLTYARPSAYHPGTFNVAFCDEHVRPLNQEIDYAVLCRLFTPRGRQARAPGTTSPLDPVHTRVPLDDAAIE